MVTSTLVWLLVIVLIVCFILEIRKDFNCDKGKHVKPHVFEDSMRCSHCSKKLD